MILPWHRSIISEPLSQRLTKGHIEGLGISPQCRSCVWDSGTHTPCGTWIGQWCFAWLLLVFKFSTLRIALGISFLMSNCVWYQAVQRPTSMCSSCYLIFKYEGFAIPCVIHDRWGGFYVSKLFSRCFRVPGHGPLPHFSPPGQTRFFSRPLDSTASRKREYPTDPFSISELQNPSPEVFEPVPKIGRSFDFHALKMWKGRSGNSIG